MSLLASQCIVLLVRSKPALMLSFPHISRSLVDVRVPNWKYAFFYNTMSIFSRQCDISHSLRDSHRTSFRQTLLRCLCQRSRRPRISLRTSFCFSFAYQLCGALCWDVLRCFQKIVTFALWLKAVRGIIPKNPIKGATMETFRILFNA